MSAFVLDTDTLTLLHRWHPTVTARVASLTPLEAAVTVITVEEQLNGWYGLLRRSKGTPHLARTYDRLAVFTRSLRPFEILTFDEPAMARYQSLLSLKLNVGSMICASPPSCWSRRAPCS